MSMSAINAINATFSSSPSNSPEPTPLHPAILSLLRSLSTPSRVLRATELRAFTVIYHSTPYLLDARVLTTDAHGVDHGYDVYLDFTSPSDYTFRCSCPDHTNRDGVVCKHLLFAANQTT